MIEYIKKGDIFDIENVTNYAHGCNCAGAMGKGIALQFKNKFPDMYLEYKSSCKNDKFNLGDVFLYKHSDGYIFNLGTQQSWRSKAQISAIKKSLNQMLELATSLKINPIALPKIGAGLGGLDWNIVKKEIENTSKKFPKIKLIIVEEFEKKK